METPHNPFRIGTLATREHFADREDEVERVGSALREPGARLVVYGPRRLGKSSLLHEAVRRVREGGQDALIVSLATASSEVEAAQRLVAALRDELGRTWREWLHEVSRSLGVGLEVSPDRVSGIPRVRLVLTRGSEADRQRFLPEVLDGLETRLRQDDRVLALCIDEFQRLHAWGGEAAEWALREAIQGHERLAYVFAGSEAGLIEAMVTGKGRALWKQVDVMPLGPIEPELLARWIWERAGATNVTMTRAAAERAVHLTHPRTRDVVQLAREVWPGPGEEVDVAAVDEAFERLVAHQAALHERIWLGLGAREQDILRVLAAADAPGHVQITASDTLTRHGLGPKSTVMSAVTRLVEDEHLVALDRGYGFDDPFFRRWIQRWTLADVGLPTPSLDEW